MPRVNEEKQLTPFAEALQDWMFHEHRIPWSRPRLAAEAGLPASTVNGWFMDVRKNPTLPGPDALRALERVTKWSREKLLELTGYAEWPAAAESESEFLRDFVEESRDLSDLEKEKFGRLITQAMAVYHARPKRPPRETKNAAPRKARGKRQEQPEPARDMTTAGK